MPTKLAEECDLVSIHLLQIFNSFDQRRMRIIKPDIQRMGMQIGQVIFGQSFRALIMGSDVPTNSTAILSASRSYRRVIIAPDGTKEKSNTTQIKRNQQQSCVNRRLLQSKSAIQRRPIHDQDKQNKDRQETRQS